MPHNNKQNLPRRRRRRPIVPSFSKRAALAFLFYNTSQHILPHPFFILELAIPSRAPHPPVFAGSVENGQSQW